MQHERLTLAIDIGGTRYRVGLVTRAGELTGRVEGRTQSGAREAPTLERVLRTARAALAEAADQLQVVAVGVGVPGPVDPWTGIVKTPPNLPAWHNLRLKEVVERELGLPCYVGNDANLAALGEYRYGAGQGLQHMVYLTLSTGIGGGIITDGRLLVGATGLAGELGHISVDLRGPRCGCGNLGCVEALASGSAIARRAVDAMEHGEASALRGRRPVTSERVFDAAQAGDALSRRIIQEAAEALGVGIVNMVHTFNPQRVVLGGGVANRWHMWYPTVRRLVWQRTMDGFLEGFSLTPALLADDSGLLGAGAYAFESLEEG